MARVSYSELIARGLASAVLSAFAWSGMPYAVAASVLMLWLWQASTRSTAFIVAFAYYAVAAFSLATGGAMYFRSAAIATAVYVSVVLALSAPWAILWHASPSLWRAPVALLLTALPPLGFIGFYSPLTAAGELWPSTGLLGLLLLFAVAASFSRFRFSVFALVALTSLAANSLASAVAPPNGWEAVDTAYGGTGYDDTSLSNADEFVQYDRLFSAAHASRARVLVFPESAVPTSRASADDFFSRDIESLRASGRTVLFGSRVIEQGRSFNSLVVRGLNTLSWTQRLPIPGAMWRPWDATLHNPAHLSGPYVIDVAGQRVAPLICYEIALVWPIVVASLDRPTLIVAISNLYWDSSSTIHSQARAILRSWSRLFSVPWLLANNA